MKYVAKFRKADGGVVDFWSGPNEVPTKDLAAGDQGSVEITEAQFEARGSVTENDGRLRWRVDAGVLVSATAELKATPIGGAPIEGTLNLVTPAPTVRG